VTYLPRPALGALDVDVTDASVRIVSELARLGGSSVLVGSLRVRQPALAGAELLLTDISSDLVHFLLLDRPYIVLNPHSQSRLSEFAAANPWSTAGDVVSLDGLAMLEQVVDCALTEDSRSAERVALAGRCLGDVSSPLERFLAEAEACLRHVYGTVPACILSQDFGEPEAAIVE
jgi:hypothetical protein